MFEQTNNCLRRVVGFRSKISAQDAILFIETIQHEIEIGNIVYAVVSKGSFLWFLL